MRRPGRGIGTGPDPGADPGATPRAAPSGVRLLALVAVLTAAMPCPGSAQAGESQVLREAAALESVGDYRGAEELLRTALGSAPTSAGALFALERVLRAQGKVEEVLGFADRFLEADPGSTGPRYLKLRVLVELDSLEAVRAEGERWIHYDPSAAEPYREVARVLGEVLGSEAAEPVLEEGIARADRGYDLALDLGDLRFRRGDFDGAGEAWAGAVGPAGENGPAVIRRISRLEGERAEVLEPMVATLGADGEPTGRRRVATQVALEGGMGPDALALAEGVVAELDLAGRRAFLTELSRQAEERRVDTVTLWALRGLRETSTVESEELALDRRIGEVSLLVGDTTAALESWRSAASGLREGSPERRRTLAQALRVETERTQVDVGSLSRALEAFKSEFPEATELDGLAAAVSVRLQAAGDMEGAEAAVRGVVGPLSALERAYVTLSGEDPAAAREDLVTAVSGLPAGRATDVIALVAFLERASPQGCAVAARTTLLAHRGSAAEAVAAVTGARAGLPPTEQAGLLAMAGRIASGQGMANEAEQAWRDLLTEFPDAPEAPEAALSLAVSRASEPEGRGEAVTLLEDLIVNRPNSPMVPAARRELQRIRGMEGRP